LNSPRRRIGGCSKDLVASLGLTGIVLVTFAVLAFAKEQ
jgi:hypothetical protein